MPPHFFPGPAESWANAVLGDSQLGADLPVTQTIQVVEPDNLGLGGVQVFQQPENLFPVTRTLFCRGLLVGKIGVSPLKNPWGNR